MSKIISFSDYANDLIDSSISSYEEIEPLDAFTFITSSDYLNEDPTPFQSLAIKTLYNLWGIYPPILEEEELIRILYRDWNIKVELDREDPVTHFIMVLGRRSTKCLTGDSEIIDANMGKIYKLGDLYEYNLHPPIFTLKNDFKFTKTTDYRVLDNGIKPCYKILTKTGRTLECTDNEPFLTIEGWKELKDLKEKDRIAVPSVLPIFVTDKVITKNAAKMDNAFITSIPKEIWNYVDKIRIGKGLKKQDIRKVKKISEYLDDTYLKNLVKADVIWDPIKSIEYVGKKQTYDLNVPDTHNFIANNIVVHNSTLASFFATYALYTLICRGNPQKYYGIRERHPIYVTHVAAKGKQAESVFILTKDNLRKVPFFDPYLDFDKDSLTELRLFTPYDKYLNDQIKQMNILLPRGELKKPKRPGSLYAKSITTSAATNRGDATFMLMLSEFAHFLRARMDPSKTADQVAEENPQSDYAIYKALVPAVKDFGEDGKIILESSPAEKGGEMYRHYGIAGGSEQEGGQTMEREVGYALLQLPTWAARPSISRESLASEFRSDSVGANAEYGAHFLNPSMAFISENVINSIPQPERGIILRNPSNWRFVICLDPGGKAKVKVADTYALGWGHADVKPDERDTTYWIDGFKGWDAIPKDIGFGKIETIPVDPNEVLNYLIELIKDLGGRNFVLEICYDQWQNQQAVSSLQAIGLPAIETTFTNPYKGQMYGDFLSKAEHGQVKMYGQDTEGWVDRWKLEMKYLQRIISGKYTYFKHPDSGPVRHDDFADVASNIVHRLSIWSYPTKETTERNILDKQGRPVRKRTTVYPVKGPGLYRGSPLGGRTSGGR